MTKPIRTQIAEQLVDRAELNRLREFLRERDDRIRALESEQAGLRAEIAGWVAWQDDQRPLEAALRKAWGALAANAALAQEIGDLLGFDRYAADIPLEPVVEHTCGTSDDCAHPECE